MPTSQAVKRAAVTARPLVALPNPPSKAVYQPWQTLVSDAQDRYRAQISEALAEYQGRLRNAETLLGVAQKTAADSADKLEAAAWTAFNNLMAQADKARAATMAPAEQAYSDVISQASTDYQDAIGNAEAAYKAVLGNVQRAMSDATASQAAVTAS